MNSAIDPYVIDSLDPLVSSLTHDMSILLLETEREPILAWPDFLNIVQSSGIEIVPPNSLEPDISPKILGKGATMTVFERVWNRPPHAVPREIVAVKELKYHLPVSAADAQRRPEGEREQLALFSLELKVLCHGALRLQPYIVRLLAVTWSEAGLPALIVEKASGDFRTLDDLMQKKKLGSADKVELLDSIMEGLDSLHALGVVHGDIKPANILMFPSLNGLTVIPKLSNFSFCRQAGEGYSSGGTKYWNAPECATPELKGAEQERSNLPSRDVFSLGLVCWNVLYEDRPFSDIGDEADSSMATRQCIYLAKSEGRLLQKLRVNAADFWFSWMFKDALDLNRDEESLDCDYAIRRAIESFLEPNPARRPLLRGFGVKLRLLWSDILKTTLCLSQVSVTAFPEIFIPILAPDFAPSLGMELCDTIELLGASGTVLPLDSEKFDSGAYSKLFPRFRDDMAKLDAINDEQKRQGKQIRTTFVDSYSSNSNLTNV